jgi:hypothetical protein
VVELSRLQTVVGLLAGLSSIGGAMYSGVTYLTAPGQGEVAVLVQEVRTERPIRDATVEILTPEDGLLTTLAPAADGWTRYPLREGGYRVRVTHLGAETRQVEVRSGQTTEVRFHLPAPAPAHAERSRRGRGAVSGFLSRLGL